MHTAPKVTHLVRKSNLQKFVNINRMSQSESLELLQGYRLWVKRTVGKHVSFCLVIRYIS